MFGNRPKLLVKGALRNLRKRALSILSNTLWETSLRGFEIPPKVGTGRVLKGGFQRVPKEGADISLEKALRAPEDGSEIVLKEGSEIVPKGLPKGGQYTVSSRTRHESKCRRSLNALKILSHSLIARKLFLHTLTVIIILLLMRPPSDRMRGENLMKIVITILFIKSPSAHPISLRSSSHPRN